MEKSNKHKFWNFYYEQVSKIKGLPKNILSKVIAMDKEVERDTKRRFKKQMELIKKYGTEEGEKKYFEWALKEHKRGKKNESKRTD